jgi:predicted esterase
MPTPSRLFVYAIIATSFLVLSACSRRGPEPKANPDALPSPQATASRTRTLGDLGLAAKAETAVKQNPTWDANQFVAQGDGLKATGQYAEAAIAYLAAHCLEPNYLYARYQLACDLLLWGEEDLAMATLQDVVRDGFWGYEMMKNDTDLEQVNQKPQFQVLLEEVKKRYPAEAAKRAGKSYLRLPQGQTPVIGWPILVFLHGYGGRAESDIAMAESAARNGFAGLAVSGAVVHWENMYAWPTGSFAATHTYLQQVLDGYRVRKDLDRGRVFLCGFSQGATQAIGLVASFPDSYEGAIAVSPGGMSPVPNEVRPSMGPRSLYVTHGNQESPLVAQLAGHCKALWIQAGRPVLVQSHAGGHQFPADWDQRFPRVLKWLEDPRGALPPER